MNADGTGVRRITHARETTAPSWFPNGSLLAFDRAPTGAPADIYLIRLTAVSAG
jgi:Tol biopolymer transport system component